MTRRAALARNTDTRHNQDNHLRTILLLRVIPILAGVIIAVAFWSQRAAPFAYPYVGLTGVVVFPVAAALIVFRRMTIIDFLKTILPVWLCLASALFAQLLIDTAWASELLSVLMGALSYLMLELLFLKTYNQGAYPLNALSRVNLVTVPLIIWFVQSTLSGLFVFVRLDPLWFILIPTVLGALLFRVTEHPTASRTESRIWMAIGAFTGLEVGWLGTLLPVSMAMQGIVAAVAFAIVLRTRRYLYGPQPARRVAITEAVACLVLFAACFITAKWT